MTKVCRALHRQRCGSLEASTGPAHSGAKTEIVTQKENPQARMQATKKDKTKTNKQKKNKPWFSCLIYLKSDGLPHFFPRLLLEAGQAVSDAAT